MVAQCGGMKRGDTEDCESVEQRKDQVDDDHGAREHEQVDDHIKVDQVIARSAGLNATWKWVEWANRW